MSRKFFVFIILVAVIIGGLFYFRYQVYYSKGLVTEDKNFEITKGEGNAQIASNLAKEGLISGKIYFYYYVRTHGILNKFLPGKYKLSGNMTIPEIANHMTREENILPGYVKITFPEGWDIRKISQRLEANGFNGKEFLDIANNPEPSIKSEFDFLTEKNIKTLEGYLFPDTYFLKKDATSQAIISKMLNNFDAKLTLEMRGEIKKQGRSIGEIVTMASIVEREVSKDEDRALVSGLFWNRIKIGQALQSDATLSYILNDTEGQHTFEQTRIDNPYNTYINRGLPPGPIANPGISSIKSVIYPKDSQFNYFLSDPKTGNTIFSKNFDEHVANKSKYGL